MLEMAAAQLRHLQCKRGELRRQMLDDIESKRWRMYDEKRKLDAADSGKPRFHYSRDLRRTSHLIGPNVW